MRMTGISTLAFGSISAVDTPRSNISQTSQVLANTQAFAIEAEGKDGPYFEYKVNGRVIRHKYVFGTEIYFQPNFPKPEKGVPYFDPNFGTEIIRISDRKMDKLGPWAKKDYGALMHPAYPKHNYENADGSYLLFNGSYKSGQVLYDAKSFKLIKSLETKAVNWNQSIDPRWDAHSLNVLYYVFSPPTAISMYDVSIDKFGVIHDFDKDLPGATCITMAEEGNCSYDSRYFAYQLRAPRGGDKWAHAAVFCYDRVEDRIVGKIVLPIPGFEGQGGGNWVGMSPSGKFVLVGTDPMLVYDREFKKPPIKLTHPGGWHCGVGLDDEGREVIFYPGSRTFSPNGQSDACYAMCDIETGIEIVLTGKVVGPQAHYDCSSIFTPGWGLVSTYHPAPLKQSHWAEYSIHLVELTRRKYPSPRIWRICHTHVNRGSGIDDPFATFNRFGTKIFFGSNWGIPIEKGGDIDVYQVELPLNWYQDLMGKEKAIMLREIAEEMVRKTW
ncbi:MAG: hypothetical protein ABSB22_18075 [Thermodesulfobacteriota bacterium]